MNNFFFEKQVIEHIKDIFEEFKDVDAENLLLKTKGRKAFQEVIDYENKELEDLVILFEAADILNKL